MKHKLNFIVAGLALLVFSGSVLAQNNTQVGKVETRRSESESINLKERVGIKFETIAKFHMVVTVLETEEQYNTETK